MYTAKDGERKGREKAREGGQHEGNIFALLLSRNQDKELYVECVSTRSVLNAIAQVYLLRACTIPYKNTCMHVYNGQWLAVIRWKRGS